MAVVSVELAGWSGAIGIVLLLHATWNGLQIAKRLLCHKVIGQVVEQECKVTQSSWAATLYRMK